MTNSLFKKRTFLSVLLVLLAFAGMAQTTFTVGDLNYRVNDDNVSVTVTGHVNGYDATGPLVIPESVSYEGLDYAVTVIGNTAFMYCFYLTSLTIPNSVTTIEEGAFAYSSDLPSQMAFQYSRNHLIER